MSFKQCKFKDFENETILGGILNEDENYIICGCCGCIIDLKEEPFDYEIIKVYDSWLNISEEIIGE